MAQYESSCNASESGSTVLRAREGDSGAWRRLAELYGPTIYNWGRRKGVNSHDAADLVQMVLLKVHRSFASFNGPSFRAWVWTICRNEIALLFRQSAGKPRSVGGTTNLRLVSDVNARTSENVETEVTAADDGVSDDSDHAGIEAELESILVRRALSIARNEFSATSIKAFMASVEQTSTAAEIGLELGISTAAVRQAKYRVLRRMRELLADS